VAWIQVKTGASSGGWVEILEPSLQPGIAVLVQGQRGLPEGARVRASR
jgi:hypothetical protein